jgi:hypothetical protein
LGIYKDLVKQKEDQINVSTWLTILETSRQSKALTDLAQYAKQKFTEQFDRDMFSTDYDEKASNVTEGGRTTRVKKPRSVLINKNDIV